MSSYKLAQLISGFIKTKQPGFYSHENFPNQLNRTMIDKDNRENENLAGSNDRSQKTVIKLRTACIWLNKLEYQYTDIKKCVFLDEHERLDMIEYRTQFVNKLEVIGPYLLEFRDDGSMEKKVYPSNCTVNGPNKRPVILITHDESTFSANNG